MDRGELLWSWLLVCLDCIPAALPFFPAAMAGSTAQRSFQLLKDKILLLGWSSPERHQLQLFEANTLFIFSITCRKRNSIQCGKVQASTGDKLRTIPILGVCGKVQILFGPSQRSKLQSLSYCHSLSVLITQSLSLFLDGISIPTSLQNTR